MIKIIHLWFTKCKQNLVTNEVVILRMGVCLNVFSIKKNIISVLGYKLYLLKGNYPL